MKKLTLTEHRLKIEKRAFDLLRSIKEYDEQYPYEDPLWEFESADGFRLHITWPGQKWWEDC